MEEKWLEDEHGKYIWRTLNGAKVKIYQNYTVSESIIMANLKKSLDKEIEATKKKNIAYVADKFTEVFRVTEGVANANNEAANAAANQLLELVKQDPLKEVKLDTLAYKKIGVYGRTCFSKNALTDFALLDIQMDTGEFGKTVDEIIEGRKYVHQWNNVMPIYDDSIDGYFTGTVPQGKMPCDEDKIPVYTLVHEYGHILEYDIAFERFRRTKYKQPEFGKINSTNSDVYFQLQETVEVLRKEATKIKNEILRIYKKDPELIEKYGKVPSYKNFISTYGLTNPREFFAELYVGSKLRQTGDIEYNKINRDNPLLKAFDKWLEKERKK